MQQNQCQPFFKPITGMESQFTINERTNTAKTTVSTGSYFAPLNQSARVKEAELSQTLEHGMEQQGSSERLSTLHKRLYQEADKIRKWKTQTEIEIKQKDKKLQEATSTVENLRKSILELQLQNENLSLKLQEEIGNKEEVMQKINSTRDMCNLLKDYSSKVEERLQKCETERTELKYLEREHLKQFEDLSSQFKELEITALESDNSLKHKLTEEMAKREALTEGYEQKMHDAERQLEKLYKRCEGNETAIQEMTNQLKEYQDKLKTMNEEYEKVLDLYNQAEANFADKSVKLEIAAHDLEKAKASAKTLENTLDDTATRLQEALSNKDKLAQNFDETEKLYIDKIKTLQEDVILAQQKQDEQSKRISEANSNLTKSQHIIEDLKCTKEMLMLERTEAQAKLGELERVKSQLVMQKAELEVAIQRAEEDKKSQDKQLERFKMAAEDLQRRLQETETERDAVIKEKKAKEVLVEKLSEQLAAKKEEFERQSKDLVEAHERENAAQEKIQNLEQELEKETETYSAKVEDLQATNKHQQQQLNGNKKEINKLKRDLEGSIQQEKAVKQTLQEVETEVRVSREKLVDLEKQLKEKQQEVESRLKEELANAKGLQDELEGRSKAADGLESKMKDLKTELSARNKHTKELEKEIRGLKSKLTTKDKADSKKNEETKQLREELDALRDKCEDLTEEKNKIREEVKREKDLCKSLQKESESGKKAVQKMTKELEASKRLHDVEMSKMCNLLEDYKMQNQKIVSDKDKEIDQIKKHMDQQSIQQNDQQVAAMRSQLEETNTQMEVLITKSREQAEQLAEKELTLMEQKQSMETREKELIEARKKYQEKVDEVKKLNFQITELQKPQELEFEIEELRKEIEKLRAQPEKPEAPLIPMFKPSRIPVKDSSGKLSEQDPITKSKVKEKGKPLGKVLTTPRIKQLTKQDGTSKNVTPQANPKTPTIPVQTLTPRSQSIRMKGTKTPQNSTPRTPTVRFSESKTPSKSILKCNGESVSKRRKVIFSESGLKYESDSEPESDVSSLAGLMEVEVAKTSVPSHDEGKDRFTESYPDRETDVTVSEKKTKSNTRKTPSKPGARFFKSPPKEKKRMTLGRKHAKQAQDLAWFESDAVFGFGPED